MFTLQSWVPCMPIGWIASSLKQIFISCRFGVHEKKYFYRNNQISLTLHRMYCSGDHHSRNTTTHGPCLSLSPEMVRTHIAPSPIHRQLVHCFTITRTNKRRVDELTEEVELRERFRRSLNETAYRILLLVSEDYNTRKTRNSNQTLCIRIKMKLPI